MHKPILAFLALGILAGCADSAAVDDSAHPSPPPSFEFVDVPEGQWLQLSPASDPKHHSWQIRHTPTYYGPVAKTEIDAECMHAETDRSVLDGPPTYFFMFGGTFLANDGAPASVARFAKEGASHGSQSIFDGNANGTENVDIWVAHAARGEHLQSRVRVTGEDEAVIVDAGPYWCLLGPWDFDAGEYRAHPSSLEASGLTWQQSFERGMRLVVHAEGIEGEVRIENTILKLDGTQTKALLCSTAPGMRTLTADLSAGGAWQLTISVLDIPWSHDCPASWLDV